MGVKKYYLDQSVFTNGKPSNFNLHDSINLYNYIVSVVNDAGITGGSSNTIYTASDSLTGPIDVTLAGFPLTFTGGTDTVTIDAAGTLTAPIFNSTTASVTNLLNIGTNYSVLESVGNLEFRLGGTTQVTIKNGEVEFAENITVPGLIDQPTGLIFTEEAESNVPTGAGKGSLFVSDGTLGLVQNELYYKSFDGARIIPLSISSEDVASLRTLSGTVAGDNDLGTFSGSTIPAGSTIKDAFQALENAVDELPNKKQDTVADIASRDALPSPVDGDIAYVIDASGDPTVDSGSAMYIYNSGIWNKIAEFESMDISVAATISDWTASTNVVVDQVVFEGGRLYRSDSNRTTGASFDATEASNWTQLTWLPGDEVIITVDPTSTNVVPTLPTPPAAPTKVKVFINGGFDYANQVTVAANGAVTVNANIFNTYGFNLTTGRLLSFVYFA